MSNDQGMRVDQWMIHVVVGGVDLGDDWEEWSGGEKKSTDVKHRLGKMGPQRSLGGRSSRSNITVQRLFRATDMALVPFLESVEGDPVAGAFTATRFPLSGSGAIIPGIPPQVITGCMIEVNPPNTQTQTDAAAMFELVLSPNENAA